MATDNNEKDYQDAFNEDQPGAAEPSENEAFGIDDDAGAQPAAVVIEVDAGGNAGEAGAPQGTGPNGSPADCEQEEAANSAAAASAASANVEANAGAQKEAGAMSTATKEVGTPGEGSAAEEASESPEVEIAENANANYSGDPASSGADMGATPGTEQPAAGGDKPMTEQQLRSWQGRLKALEAQLKQQAAATGEDPAQAGGEAIEQVGEQAEAQGNQALAEKAEDLGEQVESGQISAADAMTQLAADFGQSFVDMIAAIARDQAGKTANDAVGPIGGQVKDVIDHLSSQAERDHFNTIHGAHPDFADISETPEFKAWVAQQGPAAQQIVEKGNAAQINKLLADYKAQKSPAAGGGEVAQGSGVAKPDVPMAQADDPVNEDAVDAAEGVRSGGGMTLPETPQVADDDYEAAWNAA